MSDCCHKPDGSTHDHAHARGYYGGTAATGAHNASTGEEVRDPVCGMKVDPATARHIEHAGRTYYFCKEGCRTKFAANPGLYVRAQTTRVKAEAALGGMALT